MKKIVWTTKGLGLGGAEAILVDLAEEIQSSGWKLVVANLGTATDHSSSLENIGVEVVEFGPSPDWLEFYRWLRQQAPAVVHANNPATLAPLGLALVLRYVKCPIVYTEHNLWSSRRVVTRVAHYPLSMLPVATISVSDSVRSSGHRLRRRLSTIRHGPPLGLKSHSHSLHGTPKFVMVGGLRPNKDHQNALHAFRIVLESCESAVLHIFGDGDLRPAIEELVTELEIEAATVMHGSVPNARRYLGPDCIFLQSSVAEGLPIAIGEALAMGSMIVATDVGGTREALSTERGELMGTLCEPSDHQALAACMISAARADPLQTESQRIELAAGRTPSVTAAKYDAFYRSVL